MECVKHAGCVLHCSCLLRLTQSFAWITEAGPELTVHSKQIDIFQNCLFWRSKETIRNNKKRYVFLFVCFSGTTVWHQLQNLIRICSARQEVTRVQQTVKFQLSFEKKYIIKKKKKKSWLFQSFCKNGRENKNKNKKQTEAGCQSTSPESGTTQQACKHT